MSEDNRPKYTSSFDGFLKGLEEKPKKKISVKSKDIIAAYKAGYADGLKAKKKERPK